MHAKTDDAIRPYKPQAAFRPERDATLPEMPAPTPRGRPPRGGPPKPHAPCTHCHGPVTRRDGEETGDYNRRRCCSDYCVLQRNGFRRDGRPAGWPEITNPEENPGGRFDDYDAALGTGGAFRVSRPPTLAATATPLGGL
jgi:hypothetical protein